MTQAPVLLLALLALAVGPAAAAEAPPPVVYAQRTADYDVSLRIDPALKRYGGVYVSDRDGVLREFNAFERLASQMRGIERQDRSGPDRGPFVERVEIRLVLETPHLLGVVRRTYRDQHAAQAASGEMAVLLDRRSGRQISPLDLLKDGVDMAPLDAALQTAAERARSARDGGHPPALPDGGSLLTWDAGRMAGDRRRPPPSNVTLVPSADGGPDAGGLQFVYGPYDTADYMQGAYQAVLPASLFAAELRPAYRDDFKGDPAALAVDPLQDFPADLPR